MGIWLAGGLLEETLAGSWLAGIRGLDKHHEKYSC